MMNLGVVIKERMIFELLDLYAKSQNLEPNRSYDQVVYEEPSHPKDPKPVESAAKKT